MPFCVCLIGQNTHLVSKGLEFTGRAGIQVHELVSVYEQSRFLALILILEGSETPALYFQNTSQVSYVALKGQEPSPDLAEERKEESTLTNIIRDIDFYNTDICTCTQLN